MKNVWVNIRDFLEAENKLEVYHFPTEAALARYTVEAHRFFPRRKVVKGSPLTLLMANILSPRYRGKKSRK